MERKPQGNPPTGLIAEALRKNRVRSAEAPQPNESQQTRDNTLSGLSLLARLAPPAPPAQPAIMEASKALQLFNLIQAMSGNLQTPFHPSNEDLLSSIFHATTSRIILEAVEAARQRELAVSIALQLQAAMFQPLPGFGPSNSSFVSLTSQEPPLTEQANAGLVVQSQTPGTAAIKRPVASSAATQEAAVANLTCVKRGCAAPSLSQPGSRPSSAFEPFQRDEKKPPAQLQTKARSKGKHTASKPVADQGTPDDVPSAKFDPAAETERMGRKRRKYSHESFVCRLYRLLMDVEAAGRTDIVSFNAAGDAVMIKHPVVFAGEIVPHYFRHNRFRSFRRQLSVYGFQRHKDGPDKGAYSHRYFRRGHPELLDLIEREVVPPSEVDRHGAAATDE